LGHLLDQKRIPDRPGNQALSDSKFTAAALANWNDLRAPGDPLNPCQMMFGLKVAAKARSQE